MNRLALSPDAQEDLRQIQEYIAEELENPDAALRTVAEIIRKLRMLEQQGELGARLVSVTGLESKYRYLVCGSYLAFYRFEAETAYIDRILYGRRDFMRILFGIGSDQA